MTFPVRFFDPFAPMGMPVARGGYRPVRRPFPGAARPRWTAPPTPVEPEPLSTRPRREPDPQPAQVRRTPLAQPPPPEPVAAGTPTGPAAPISPPEVPTAASTREEQDGTLTDEERLRQAFGELQAAKRRVERDAEHVQQETRAALVKKLFPVLDSLDRALSASSGESALAEGVRLVREQFEHVLLDYGLERIASVGHHFDPAEHEAVGVVQVDSENDHGKVMQEWEAGYRFAGRVLRAAKVTVGRLSSPMTRPN